MIVVKSQFEAALKTIALKGKLSLDTETTGLRPFGGSRLFSIIVSVDDSDYYFNWNYYPDMDKEALLDKRHVEGFQKLLSNSNLLIYMHNAKFDLHMLKNEWINVEGRVHCTQAIGRLVENTLFDYSLDSLSKKFLGQEKDNTVEKYILENNLFTITTKGEEKIKNLQYFKVPLEKIVPYGERDSRLTYDLGEYQRKFIEEKDSANASSKKLTNVYQNEMALTKTLFRMEQKGIKISEEYCRKSYNNEIASYKEIMGQFKALTGLELVDSRKTLVPAFEKLGLSYGRTEKGNASFTDEILSKIDNPLSKLIQNYRSSYKMAHSYYKNFLDFADDRGLVHTDFDQGGAETGRMSARRPALQTLPKGEPGVENDAALVRRCFVPRSSDYVFFIPDYQQMEYRFMLEYAGEMEVIKQVLTGLDVHEATAKILGISRQHAKTINFLLIYGGGANKLAGALGCSVFQARKIIENYFSTLPKVKEFIKGVDFVAKNRGYIINWLGRISIFSNPDFSYKAANSLIQGGTADVMKMALNNCDKLLLPTQSFPVLTVHDELVFELHKSELHLAPKLQNIMETTYKHKFVPLLCDPSYSWKSLADKQKGYPAA